MQQQLLHDRWEDFDRQLMHGLDDVSRIISVLEELYVEMYCRGVGASKLPDIMLARSTILAHLEILKAHDIKWARHEAAQLLRGRSPVITFTEYEAASARKVLVHCKPYAHNGSNVTLKKVLAFLEGLLDQAA